MLGQMKRQLENSRCFRQGMEKDLEECAEARWLAKPVLDSRALPLDSDKEVWVHTTCRMMWLIAML